MALNEAGLQRRPYAALLLDLAEGRPRRGAERVCHGFQRAGAGGGIADAGEVRFFQEHKLGIARDAAGERVGQTQRRGVRQHRDGIGAAQARGSDRNRGAQTCSRKIARVIMRQAVSAVIMAGFGVRPQACSTRAHNFRAARNFAMVKN